MVKPNNNFIFGDSLILYLISCTIKLLKDTGDLFMKKYIMLFVSVSTLLLGACTDDRAGSDDVHNLTLAHNHPTTHPVHESLEKFKEEVEERSDGDISISIYPNGALGDEREVIDMNQIGSSEQNMISADALVNI